MKNEKRWAARVEARADFCAAAANAALAQWSRDEAQDRLVAELILLPAAEIRGRLESIAQDVRRAVISAADTAGYEVRDMESLAEIARAVNSALTSFRQSLAERLYSVCVKGFMHSQSERRAIGRALLKGAKVPEALRSAREARADKKAGAEAPAPEGLDAFRAAIAAAGAMYSRLAVGDRAIAHSAVNALLKLVAKDATNQKRRRAQARQDKAVAGLPAANITASK